MGKYEHQGIKLYGKLLFKTDLGGQLVMHKLHAATNTLRQNLYF